MAIEDSDFATSGEINPGANAEAVTPADVDLTKRTRAIYLGGTGDLSVKMADNGQIVTFQNVQAGSMLPLRVTQIRVASTATSIVAVW